MKICAFEESDIRVMLPENTRKFDEGKSHGLTHCMKAVDFVVEMADRVLFIELKDIDQPKPTAKDSDKFIMEFSSGKLDLELTQKYRDSFLYEWASGKNKKPGIFLVLIGASNLKSAELLARTDALKRKLPIDIPKGTPWIQSFVSGCAVLNLDAWNKLFPQFKAIRISTL